MIRLDDFPFVPGEYTWPYWSRSRRLPTRYKAVDCRQPSCIIYRLFCLADANPPHRLHCLSKSETNKSFRDVCRKSNCFRTQPIQSRHASLGVFIAEIAIDTNWRLSREWRDENPGPTFQVYDDYCLGL